MMYEVVVEVEVGLEVEILRHVHRSCDIAFHTAQ